ncbi:MAG: purine-binding chemotaxis protein CheW [Oceanospirillaceae bacterium]|nr:purine-binding chemotaxis protein CheW [Oceanospirillaceae bacterium]
MQNAEENNFGMGVSVGEDQYLTFIIAQEEYGVDILRVQEIKGWSKTTPIPNTPDYIKGVMNLRGAIVPIIDLRERFGLPPLEYGPMTVVIVLSVFSEERERLMGVVVDAVSDVYNVKPDDLKPAPDLGGKLRSEFIKGLATVDEKLMIVIDIDNLLNSDELSLIKDASA